LIVAGEWNFMTAAGPWSVKGIDPKAREMAKDLARRSGMTLGEWLNQMIIDGVDGDLAPPPPFEDAPAQSQRPAAARAPYRSEAREPTRRRLLDEMYREATFARDAEAEIRQEAVSRRIPERGYRTPGSAPFIQADANRPDFGRAEQSWPEPRRAAPPPTLNADDSELVRITRALEALSARLETAEHRSTLAISGIDQSVMGVLTRLDGLDESQGQATARLEGAIDQVRETQARVAERVRRMEQEDGSRVDALRALEGALTRLAGHINESSAKADATAAQVHEDVEALGRRLNKLESGADAAAALLAGAAKTREDLDAVNRRVEAVENAVSEAPDSYADADKVETVLARLAERLERAEARTTAAVRSLETSFAGLDARLRTTEARSRETDVVGEVDRRFQTLAADLSQKVDASRAEFAERLRGVADAAKPDAAKLGTLEKALLDLTGQVAQAERRSAQAIDRIGREVVTIAQSLGERVSGVEARSTAAVEHMGGEMARISDAIEGRLTRADAAQAEALEKLGGEIARIAERLTERIAASDKRSAETLDAAAGKFARLTETLSDRQDQTASELSTRIRQSEERTAKLLEDAREKLELQTLDLLRKALRDAALRAAEAAPPPPPPHTPQAVEPAPAFEPSAPETPAWSPGLSADPFSADLSWRAPAPMASPEDPFVASKPPAPPPAEARRPAEEPAFHGPAIDEPSTTRNWQGGLAGGALLDPEPNPFDPDDDFQALSPSPKFSGPPPSGFDLTAAEHLDPPGFDAPVLPELEPFGDFAVRDFVAAPDPERPSSTREMLDQARAAAKRAAGGREGSKANGIPAPAFDGAEPKPFGVSFSSKTKKTGTGGSTLRTVGLASVWACAITSAAVGAYSLAVKDGGGQDHNPVAEAPTAATPPSEEAQADAAKPQLAMALSQPPASSAPATSAEGTAAPAGPVSKAAAALGETAAPSVGRAGVALKTTAVKPQTPATAAPQLATPAAGSSDTARSLYDDSVRRIESGDAGAVNDLKRAANLGLAPAQFYLGRLYEAGAAGLAKDMVEARRWTQRAAQGGDPAAMYNLASYLYAGDGGSKDPAGAAEWFRKAAERGVVNSQYNLAQLYETGHGVPKNLAEAYKWYLVAADAGDPEAKANVTTLKAEIPADARAIAERAAAVLHSQLASQAEGTAHLAAATSPNPPR
jgi:localization factor PodJL